MGGEYKQIFEKKQTNGLLTVEIHPVLISLGDSGLSKSIYRVIVEYFSDEFNSICCDDPGPKCSAEMNIGNEDGIVCIDYVADSTHGVVIAEWYSDDGVSASIVEDHIREVIECAYYDNEPADTIKPRL